MDKLKKIKCFLLDMDGTVYLSGKAILGAAEAVQRMRKNARVFFITNNTSVSRHDYVVKLASMGIHASDDDIYTAGNATIDYIKTQDKYKKIYLFGTDALKSQFSSEGITLVDNDPDLVVIGFHTKLTYDELSKACGFIREGVPYLATHPDFNCPVLNGYIPDVGSFLACIKASTGVAPIIICGKPYAPMANGVAKIAKAQKKEIAMVGDRLMTDMQFAINNGFTSVLVLSGEATMQAYKDSGMQLDCVLNSISDYK